MEEYWTISQAAKIIGYSDRRIRELCKAGKIPGAFKLPSGGRKWQIPRKSVTKYQQGILAPSESIASEILSAHLGKLNELLSELTEDIAYGS